MSSHPLIHIFQNELLKVQPSNFSIFHSSLSEPIENAFSMLRLKAFIWLILWSAFFHNKWNNLHVLPFNLYSFNLLNIQPIQNELLISVESAPLYARVACYWEWQSNRCTTNEMGSTFFAVIQKGGPKYEVSTVNYLTV